MRKKLKKDGGDEEAAWNKLIEDIDDEDLDNDDDADYGDMRVEDEDED